MLEATRQALANECWEGSAETIVDAVFAQIHRRDTIMWFHLPGFQGHSPRPIADLKDHRRLLSRTWPGVAQQDVDDWVHLRVFDGVISGKWWMTTLGNTTRTDEDVRFAAWLSGIRIRNFACGDDTQWLCEREDAPILAAIMDCFTADSSD